MTRTWAISASKPKRDIILREHKANRAASSIPKATWTELIGAAPITQLTHVRK